MKRRKIYKIMSMNDEPHQQPFYEETPKDFLKKIRSQTCYPVLRGLLVGLFILSIIGIIIVAYFQISIISQLRGMGVFAILQLISVMLLVAAVIAAWKLSTMFIDIADTLIEQTRKKKP